MTYFDRRNVLGGIAAGLVARPAIGQSVEKDIRERLSRALQNGKVSGLHALLIGRGSDIVFEHYGRGEDEVWGRPLGIIDFAPDVLHDVRSVSKSVVVCSMGLLSLRARYRRPRRSFMSNSRNIGISPFSQDAIGSRYIMHSA